MGLPLWPYLVCAALTGLAGGNYSASLAKVDGLFPQRLKGITLGLIGGMANLGAATIQAVGLVVLATAGHTAPYWVCDLSGVAGDRWYRCGIVHGQHRRTPHGPVGG